MLTPPEHAKRALGRTLFKNDPFDFESFWESKVWENLS